MRITKYIHSCLLFELNGEQLLFDPGLHAAAGRSVLAHLLDLQTQARVARDGETWRLVA